MREQLQGAIVAVVKAAVEAALQLEVTELLGRERAFGATLAYLDALARGREGVH